MDPDTLAALCDCIVPPDDWPGACDLDVPAFVVRMVELGDAPPHLADGLVALEAEATHQLGRAFHEATPDAQHDLLAKLERGNAQTDWPIPANQWFDAAVTLVCQGYYGDPGNGANFGETAWAMIGYRAGATRGRA